VQALNFAFKDKYKEIFCRPASEVGFWLFFAGNLAAGGAAGATSLLFVYPLDFARTRYRRCSAPHPSPSRYCGGLPRHMVCKCLRVWATVARGYGQSTGGNGGRAAVLMSSPLRRLGADVGKGEDRQFTGLFDCIGKIYKTDGLAGLYQGFAASIAGIIVYRAAFFGGYDTLKAVCLQAGFGAAVWQAFIVAEISTALSGFISYPFDTVRRRLMMKSGGGSKVKYAGTLDCAVKIVQQEGIGGLFNGALSNTFRGTGAALVLVMYDWMSKFF